MDNLTTQESIQRQVMMKCIIEIYCNNREDKIEGSNIKEKFKTLLEAFNQ
ncbi:MAG: hypothetical protein AABY22_15590 [Nanoarchaeota archaeon]